MRKANRELSIQKQARGGETDEREAANGGERGGCGEPLAAGAGKRGWQATQRAEDTRQRWGPLPADPGKGDKKVLQKIHWGKSFAQVTRPVGRGARVQTQAFWPNSGPLSPVQH